MTARIWHVRGHFGLAALPPAVGEASPRNEQSAVPRQAPIADSSRWPAPIRDQALDLLLREVFVRCARWLDFSGRCRRDPPQGTACVRPLLRLLLPDRMPFGTGRAGQAH